MTIDKIGPLNKILKTQSDIQVKKSNGVSKKDRVELSTEAKRMAELSQVEAKAKAAPDIRKELTPQRIKELRDKLENPDAYLTKEVAEKIAEKVAESFGIT
ncbi:MAG TPA: flagellar biosynthesis anti-sigma factor FlgM [Spirochaetota bacterium]|nr:flagellar biosynthesis anti-sigma factor FlgM [Spirochaetota bacterium]